jgi:putative transposase
MDNKDIGKYELSAYWAVLASQLEFAKNLNSMAGQARTERAWSVISGFYDNCKKHKPGKRGILGSKKNKHMVLLSTKPVDGSFPKSGDISLSLTV